MAATGANPRRPLVVAVDGRSGSGKTAHAARLASQMEGAAVVHTDDVAWNESFSGWSGLLVDGVLGPLHRGAGVAFRPPAWERHGRPGRIEVAPGAGLVVVEGVGAARRSLRSWYDAIVWVETDVELCRRRGLVRDAEAARAAGDPRDVVAFWDEWQAQEVPFLAEDRPWEVADLVVDGSGPVG